jgi:uncharacterized membrane protein
MKRFSALLFFVYLCMPVQVFAECRDPSKVVIGFLILFSAVSFFLLLCGLLTYWLARGRKYTKVWAALMAFSVLLGIFSVMMGFIKEQNNNSDRIPFLSEKCD